MRGGYSDSLGREGTMVYRPDPRMTTSSSFCLVAFHQLQNLESDSNQGLGISWEGRQLMKMTEVL